MNYLRVLPEIVVGLGDDTEYDNDTSPKKKITKLHLNIEDWLGDDLMWNFPETIVTLRLKDGLKKTQFSGYYFDEIKVTKDIYFDYNFSNTKHGKPLPPFYWMRITGKEGVDDFFVKEGELYVSERAFQFIKDNYDIHHLEIEPKEDEFDELIKNLIQKDLAKQKF
ncbi:hypothetical protein [Neisseria montereyensis]|uniref:Uncharacterized protein n=1 Tax=Neisseria montereyensis TaxID=2973938 RepID=A0ABT2FC93_9NEIS|nr:hypothetical protein [Neisseria montereyensis]MCS4533829.1 hypothetical protein [Neisseria montereyensis]